MVEDTRKHEIQLEAILKRLEEGDPTEMGGMFGNKAQDLTTSKDFTRLESFLEEVHDELDKDTNQLKSDAKTNKLANALQVAKELIQFKTETAFYKKQVKHNAGARDARIKIIKQNDEIIARNKDLQKLLKEARGRAAGGGGTGGGTGGAPPVTGGGTGGGDGGGTGGGDGGGTGGGLSPAQLEEELAAQLQGYDSVEDKIKQTGWESDEQKASYMKQKKIDREKATTELSESKGRAPKRMEIETKRGPSRKVDTAAEVNSSDGTRRDPTAWGTKGMIEGTYNDEFFAKTTTAGTLDSEQAAKDREDVFGDKGLGENDKNMRKIRLGREREGLVRAERDKTGNIKFRDEQRGSYADATQFIKSEGAVGALAGDIRAGMGYAGGTRNRAASMASKGSATLSKNLGQNAADVQKQMDDLREKDAEAANKAQTELATLSKMMATQAAGGKDADGKKVTADEVREQAARVEQVMETTDQGKKMNTMLGMSDVRNDLSSERGVTTAFKNFAGVDSDAGFGKGMKQAFTAERLFGKDSKLASVFGGGGQAVENRVAEAKATQQLAVEDQAAGVKSALSEDRLGILTDKDLGIEETEEAVEKIEAKQAVAVEEASAKVEESKEVGATVQAETTAKKKDTKERTGQDTETVQEKQLETLIEIRDILERTAGGGGGGGGPGAVPPPGLFKRLFGGGKKPPVPGAKPGAKPPGRMARMFSKGGAALKGAGPAAQGFAQGSGGGLMKGALRGATRFGGAIAGVGMGIYEGVTGFKDAGARGDAGEIGAEEEQIAKGEAIGGGAGGAGGAIAGAAAGAAIGSVIPVVGTVIGGLVGGAIGYFAGRWAGKKAGGAIADAIPVSAEQLAESNKLAETTLENVEERDSDLAKTIALEAKEIETQMLEEAGDEVSDNDKAAIENAALVKAIQNHTNEIDALPEPTDATQSPGAMKWDKQMNLVKAGTGTKEIGDFSIDKTNQESVDDLTKGGAVGIARNMGFTNEEIASPGGPLSSYEMSSDLGGARITSLGGRDVSQEQSDQFRIQKKILTSGEDALFNETTKSELGGELVEGGMTPTAIAEQKQPKSRGTARGRAMRARLNRVKAFSNTKGIIDFDEGMPLNKGIDKAGDPAKIEAWGAGGMVSATLPTSEAIENMTAVTAQTAEENPPTVVVANQPAPPAPVAPSDGGPNIAVMPPRVRTSDSVIQRYQDKRFRV